MNRKLTKFTEDVGRNNEALGWLREDAWARTVAEFDERIEGCRARASRKARSNVLDPFNLAAVAAVERLDMDRIMSSVALEQTVRCIGNAVGAFHETLLSRARGWHKGQGYDVGTDPGVSPAAIAELKNKWNTVKATDRPRALERLDDQRRTMPRGTLAYFVEIVPKKPARYCVPSRRTSATAPTLFECDGATFYTLVSGREDALREVLSALMPCIGVDPDVADWLRGLESLPK